MREREICAHPKRTPRRRHERLSISARSFTSPHLPIASLSLSLSLRARALCCLLLSVDTRIKAQIRAFGMITHASMFAFSLKTTSSSACSNDGTLLSEEKDGEKDDEKRFETIVPRAKKTTK